MNHSQQIFSNDMNSYVGNYQNSEAHFKCLKNDDTLQCLPTNDIFQSFDWQKYSTNIENEYNSRMNSFNNLLGFQNSVEPMEIFTISPQPVIMSQPMFVYEPY
mmetsp:Transcript_34956/g.34631  ORF Transcript_34956/g.34631 Transcript_34956/m.34631 type:complete len:103 (+) Transcript_34956:26-334(+)